ncbi:hypothetical protein F511_35025 [Dorcoceras hygrometricum]|uniref:Uncharacterized protein n=1 Tax=Dorcoceras hygrometricum TaxID=472368 RepID=A0A2Z7AXC0_9LAMI|nr:hypothetical protein F511_35025 [Dorcoceras hygrometricum]
MQHFVLHKSVALASVFHNPNCRPLALPSSWATSIKAYRPPASYAQRAPPLLLLEFADELSPCRGPRERRASGTGDYAHIPATNEHSSDGAGSVSSEAPPMLKSAACARVNESKYDCGVKACYLAGTCAWLQPVFQEPGASRLIAVDTPIRSTTRSETPSSDCTRSPDEISTIGFSTSNWVNHQCINIHRIRQSGPRPDSRLLRQTALEVLTRSARSDSPRRTGRKQFSGDDRRRRKGGGGGGLSGEEGRAAMH